MKLKLKESIRANGIQYMPPEVVDCEEIGITQADADVLVRRGTAEVVDEVAPIDPNNTETPEGLEKADLVEGTLAGVVEADGKVVPLANMKKDDLVALASGMGIDTAGKNKADLVAAIEAEKVKAAG